MLSEMNWKEAVTLASPYPYLLVTSRDATGVPNAMGVGWWSFTSMTPPLMLVSIGKGRYTLDCIRHTKDFVMCFPGKDIAKASWTCGVISGRDGDKLEKTGLKALDAKKVKSPIIEGSSAAFECVVTDEVETGDHIVFIGEIVAMHGDADNPQHLYSIFYNKLVSMDTEGNRNFFLEFK
jgi:flavin reductase (DIM6/NTAB) family NADH-FMN oxidoreductase RutF